MKVKKTITALLLAFAIILSNVAVFAAGTPVAAAAGITSLTGQELVDEGLIEDINFANAIADSINADPVFYSGKQMSEFDSLEEILNDYNGVINAQNKGIASIEGFHHIRKAKEVHLENNQISDIRPIADGLIGDTVPDSEYYGTGTQGTYQNVDLYLANNPILHFPAYMGGFIEPLDLVRNDIIVPHNFVFMSNGNEPNFDLDFAPGITIEAQSVDFEQKAPAYFMDGAYMDATTGYKTTNKTNGKFETDSLYNDHRIVLLNISETGSGFFSFGLAGNSTYSSNVATQFNVTKVDYTAKFLFPITVSIYNQIKLTNEIKTNHTITFTKTGKDGAKLPGAVYELYQELPDGDKLIGEYTTGTGGTFTVPADVLNDGTFYFLEKTAPAGHTVNPQKVYVNLSSGTVEVTANAGKEITTNDGQNQNTVTIDGKGTFALGGSYTDDQGVEHYNDDIQLKVTPPTGGALKSLTVSRTAGKGTADTQTFDKEADALVFIKNAVKEYANVEISAEFEMNVSASQSDAPSTSFKITKEVIGGEAEKPFDFTVELYNPGGNTAYSGSFLVNGITQTYTGPFTVSVAGGGEAIIGGLPVGVVYKIVEETPAGWINLSGMQMGTLTREDIVRDGMVVTLSEVLFRNLKIPPMSYTMEKERVTSAKLKPGTTDKYGFAKGDEVEYAVTIKNTGNASLSMDVTDAFADPDKFSNLSVKSVEGDGVVKNSDLTGPVGVNITIEEGKTATVTFTATVAKDIENLSDAAKDDGKGYENIAETSNVKGEFSFKGSTFVCSSDPGRGEDQYPDNPDGTNPLDPQKDTANTPVMHKIPQMSYTMQKDRITGSKLKPGTTDKYGFEKGDVVEYAVTIENTGDSPLSMDVTDAFADPGKFSNLSVKSVVGDGVVKNSDLTSSVGVNITIPAGKKAVITFTATVATDVELLSGAVADDGKGHENTAKTSNVKGTYTDDDGNTFIYSADPKDGEEQYPDNPDGTNPLDDKKDTANTPVKHIIPAMSYVMEKERITPAKLKPGTTDKYGFAKGDVVEYAVTIENTGDCALTMDVTDVFADMDKFTGLSVKSVEGDGVVKNSDLTGPVGVNITIPAGKTATVIFTATVETDIELLSGSEADDGKGYENTAETSNVKGTYTDDDGNTFIYSADPKDGEEQYPDNPDGTNPLDDKKDTANTPVFAEEPPTPPVDPEEPETPDPGQPENPDPEQPENPEPTPPKDVPQTGDNTNIALWLAVMGTALCGLIASLFLSRRQQQKTKHSR